MYAAKNKSAQAPAIVERLLKAGAEVNAADDVSSLGEGVVWGVIYIDKYATGC